MSGTSLEAVWSESASVRPVTVASMQRVAVIGCGGSGKTTLANALANRLGAPVIHIDSHYWKDREGERVESTPEEREARHRELIAQPRWVMDGMKLGGLHGAPGPSRHSHLPRPTHPLMPLGDCAASPPLPRPIAPRPRGLRPHQLDVSSLGVVVSQPATSGPAQADGRLRRRGRPHPPSTRRPTNHRLDPGSGAGRWWRICGPIVQCGR